MISQFPHSTSACEYQRLANGIHVFTIRIGNRAGIDDLIQQFEKVVQLTPDNEVIRYLVDVHHVYNMSVTYTLREVRRASLQYPHRSRTRGAHIHSNTVLAQLAETMLNLIIRNTGDQAKFFHFKDYDRAVEWVLED